VWRTTAAWNRSFTFRRSREIGEGFYRLWIQGEFILYEFFIRCEGGIVNRSSLPSAEVSPRSGIMWLSQVNAVTIRDLSQAPHGLERPLWISSRPSIGRHVLPNAWYVPSDSMQYNLVVH
jgi:hypothetical protein